MNKTILRADGLLVLTAAIWGFAFVAQRQGMSYMGPLTYNGIRFTLGTLSLVPLLLGQRKKIAGSSESSPLAATDARNWKKIIASSCIAGTFLCLGVNLQQAGIVYTTAGKAGFLTGLYVVQVPLVGLFFGHRIGIPTWIGALLATIGMYILSVPDELGRINPGDLLVILSSVAWTAHVLYLDHATKRTPPLFLAAGQFVWCALLSLTGAFIGEAPQWCDLQRGLIPLVYGGIASVGIAYTLQVIAQRDAPPAHAAIILCLEGAFATIGGIVILGEPFGFSNLLGSTCMFAGMVTSQWEMVNPHKKPESPPRLVDS